MVGQTVRLAQDNLPRLSRSYHATGLWHELASNIRPAGERVPGPLFELAVQPGLPAGGTPRADPPIGTPTVQSTGLIVHGPVLRYRRCLHLPQPLPGISQPLIRLFRASLH